MLYKNLSDNCKHYILLGVPGAPLREALINAGIGEDIDGGYVTEIKLPYFSVIAKNARLDQKDDFLKVMPKTLTTNSS